MSAGGYSWTLEKNRSRRKVRPITSMSSRPYRKAQVRDTYTGKKHMTGKSCSRLTTQPGWDVKSSCTIKSGKPISTLLYNPVSIHTISKNIHYVKKPIH